MTVTRPLPQIPALADPKLTQFLKDLVSELSTLRRTQVLISGGNAPPGSIVIWTSDVIPDGWLLCNNALYDSAVHPALYAAIGTSYNIGGEAAGWFRVPGAINRFLIGAGGTYALGSRGGASTALLDVTHLPEHAHLIVDKQHTHPFTPTPHNHPTTELPHGHAITDPGHSHGTTDPGHVHSGVLGPTGAFNGAGGVGGASGDTASATTGITVDDAVTGITLGTATTGLTVGNASADGTVDAAYTGLTSTEETGGGTPFSILNPYLALNFIIRT